MLDLQAMNRSKFLVVRLVNLQWLVFMLSFITIMLEIFISVLLSNNTLIL